MRLTEAYNLDPGSSIRFTKSTDRSYQHYSSQNNFSLFRYCCIVPNSFVFKINLHHEYPCIVCELTVCPCQQALLWGGCQRWRHRKATLIRWDTLGTRLVLVKITTGRQSVWINRHISAVFRERRRGAPSPNPEQRIPQWLQTGSQHHCCSVITASNLI